MKLRTIMCGGPIHRWPSFGDRVDVLHDAIVAHALLMAMGKVPEHLSGSNATRWIETTADELLSEWGYGDVGG